MQEKEHVLSILEKLKVSLKDKEYISIKSLSNHFVHHCTIDQDPDIISLAVIIYSLSKLIERNNFHKYRGWDNFYEKYINAFDEMIIFLKKDDINNFRKNVEDIRNLIQGLTGRLKDYINDVFRKAKINKASRIYEHGISMEKTAKILGVTMWELSEYSGNTGISDVNLSITLPINQRIKMAKDIFK